MRNPWDTLYIYRETSIVVAYSLHNLLFTMSTRRILLMEHGWMVYIDCRENQFCSLFDNYPAAFCLLLAVIDINYHAFNINKKISFY